jgi:tetratricopeptide (TPR) repeat protein
LNNITSPIRSFAHIDLLPLARRIWKYRLESRSLKNIEVEILKTKRTQEEIPGWEIPQIYFDYLRSEDARPLKSVFYHNAMDVLSLAALFQFLAGFTHDPFSIPAPYSIDLVALANLYEDLGDLEAASRYYEIGLKEHLPRELHHKTLERFARMHRKSQNWEKALQLWESGCSEDDLYSLIELAKFYEHHEKSPEKALDFAKIALKISMAKKIINNASAFSEVEIEKRIKRLKGNIKTEKSKRA